MDPSADRRIMSIRNEEKPYRCELCSEAFQTESLLRDHGSLHVSVGLHNCTECDKSFTTSLDLQDHLKFHSTGDDGTAIVCKFCSKSFLNEAGLNIHINKIHLGEKKYRCYHCGESFRLERTLRMHMRFHFSDKPYSCSLCDFTSRYSKSLLAHITRKHEEKTIMCSLCDKLFANEVDWKNHEKNSRETG